MRKLAGAVLLLALAAPAGAGTLAGVTLPDRVEAGGQPLVLNGMGVRKKAIIKVYVAGLYLPAKQGDASAILGAEAPRRLVMHFTFGVSREKLCDAWNEGLENNTPGASAALRGDFETLCGYMDDVERGDQMVFTYLPGTGTTVEAGGQAKGTIAGKEFADALFACWIGGAPPSADFKDGILGG